MSLIRLHYKIILLILILLAFFVRVYNLDKNPYGFFSDEASIGYNAYKILTTGADEVGRKMPLFFKAFGEYKNPIFIYLDVPLIFIFGIGEFAVRMLSVILGSLSVLTIYFAGQEIFNKKSGLIAAFLLAISAWHIHYSRIGFELISFPLFFLLSLYIFLVACKKNSNRLFFLSSSLFGVTIYSYGAARIFIPIFFILLILIYRKNIFINKNRGILFVSIFLIVFLPVLNYIIGSNGVTNDKRFWALNDKSPYKEKIIKFSTSYLNHFNPLYLFIKDEASYPGHFISRELPQNASFIYRGLLPFFYLGLLILITSKKRRYKLIFVGLLLYPLADVVTNYEMSSTRSIIGSPLIFLTSTLGLLAFCDFIAKKLYPSSQTLKNILISIFLGFVYLEFVFYFTVTLPKYPNYSSDFWGWQYGPKPIMEYFLKNQTQYDQLIMAGEFNGAEIFPRFYAKDGCKKCIVGGFEKYDPTKKQLFAMSWSLLKQSDYEGRLKTIKNIFYPDGRIAFVIGEVKRR